MIYYIADLHLGHTNAIMFDKRPFKDAREMDEVLIANWNKRVNEKDEVYIIGDFCHRSARPPEEYLAKLKGRKHLIKGNHDGPILKSKTAMSMFRSIEDIASIKDHDRTVILCHYPLAEWPYYFRGAWHVYGHIHAHTDTNAFINMSKEDKALNAGCMINGYMPVTFSELIENNKQFNETALKGETP